MNFGILGVKIQIERYFTLIFETDILLHLESDQKPGNGKNCHAIFVKSPCYPSSFFAP